MSDRVENSALVDVESAGLKDGLTMLRDLLSRYGEDGTRSAGGGEHLAAIAANTALKGMVASVAETTHALTARTKLIDCPAGSYIVLFSLSTSLSAAMNVQFVDAAGNRMLATIWGAANSNTSRIYPQGLAISKSLYTVGSAASNHSVQATYVVIG